ncbi:MAG: hypothetical protein V4724_16120 [Pseudomonadota bacterium]
MLTVPPACAGGGWLDDYQFRQLLKQVLRGQAKAGFIPGKWRNEWQSAWADQSRRIECMCQIIPDDIFQANVEG